MKTRLSPSAAAVRLQGNRIDMFKNLIQASDMPL
ncbi:hypothetical protein M703_12095 [Neisseria gonorrhoeae SK29344]|nr:hypothetical protein T556_09865 [Neisseria gonorrhoeae NG-k51.05]KLR78137.1 hypothetical protein M717_01675 [Neisseria gonorrhoeae SK33414]KLR79543.1 hypothetical protein M680_11200 [Neisseria gonorrhoeae SK8976]KLR92443.1 hypothetical protein M678_12335 [Neisseria gonorrhoeae SK7461]KLR93235.1 hypothetical protein M685_12035 [Neisseria gonorrhoeae SK16259]KLS07896.1 hypothetical protein M703_12095 [Neisseria gonorrhoeae SK29344]KLS10282.1 hypothetical protein M716_11405 [Neisseria gonorrh